MDDYNIEDYDYEGDFGDDECLEDEMHNGTLSEYSGLCDE